MNIPTSNLVRTAEEFAMVDVLNGGRVIAGMFRGTSNEYVTHNTNPAESRERFSRGAGSCPIAALSSLTTPLTSRTPTGRKRSWRWSTTSLTATRSSR